MSFSDAVKTLKKRYANAESGNVVLEIHLFAIEFANDIETMPLNDLAEQATGHRSYGTEIRKGVRISSFVELKG